MATLEEYLELIEEDLQDSKNTIGSLPGPLQDPELNTVRTLLQQILDNIIEGLALINNVGTADTSNKPATLPGIAEYCADRAASAHVESQRPTPNNISIGNDIKTISWLITTNSGYRSKAGIT